MGTIKTGLMATLCLAFGVVQADNIECLAKNIYFEARDQNREGQYAVAIVTLNRVYDDKFPDSICEVVYQRNQFSWYWDGASDEPDEAEAWVDSLYLAVEIYVRYEHLDDKLDGALYYKREDTAHRYFNGLTPIVVIGDHGFFK